MTWKHGVELLNLSPIIKVEFKACSALGYKSRKPKNFKQIHGRERSLEGNYGSQDPKAAVSMHILSVLIPG
jgi:hypothetical protein